MLREGFFMLFFLQLAPLNKTPWEEEIKKQKKEKFLKDLLASQDRQIQNRLRKKKRKKKHNALL